MEAESVSSSSAARRGAAYEAYRNGSVVVASVCRERWRKEISAARGAAGVVCARNDSRPEEKAKEPSGSAESLRRRKMCDGGGGFGRCGVAASWRCSVSLVDSVMQAIFGGAAYEGKKGVRGWEFL